MPFLDKTGLAHLWNHIVSRLNRKAEVEALDNLEASLTEKIDNIDLSAYETTANAQLKLDEAKEYTDTKTANLVNATTVDNKITTHNTTTDAHNDIRILISELSERLNAIADSDDETLDQMSEIVEYIKANKALIDSVTTSKVSVSDIIDNLTTNVSNKPLSAAQGVAIKALIDTITDAKADWNQGDANAIDYIKNRTHWVEQATEIIVAETSETYVESLNGELFGGTYIVTVDGVKYICETYLSENYEPSLGDSRLLNDDISNPMDVPFCAASYWDAPFGGSSLDAFAAIGVVYPDSNTHTIQIEKITGETTYHTLDENFIPDSIARTEDIAEIYATKDELSNCNPIVTTAGDGAAYTATINGITTLTNGMKITIIPHVASTTQNPTLNLNGLGAKYIRMPVAYNSGAATGGAIAAWLTKSKPVTLQYNGTYWLTSDMPRASALYLHGAVPVANGGTGAETAEDALVNLGITATAAELNYMDGVTGNVQQQLDDMYSSTLSRTANTVLAAPNGSNGGATFRKLVGADLPTHIHYSAGSAGVAGYVQIATLTISGTYQDSELWFKFGQRAYGVFEVFIRFWGVGDTDPDVGYFEVLGDSAGVYLAKNGSSSWSLYIKKQQGWDTIDVLDCKKGYCMNGVSVEWGNSLVTELPSGYKEAILRTESMNISGNAATATTANALYHWESYSSANSTNVKDVIQRAGYYTINNGDDVPTSAGWHQFLNIPANNNKQYGQVLCMPLGENRLFIRTKLYGNWLTDYAEVQTDQSIFKLSSSNYGTTLPTAGTAGRVFFKKV